ncbi:MAG TPA: hypothetical protein VI138_02870 [Candidatus Dormibacteraeota bacterium]
MAPVLSARTAVPLAVLVLASLVPVSAASPGAVDGVLLFRGGLAIDQSLELVRGGTVTLRDQGGSSVAPETVRSDRAGRFRLSPPPGTYLVESAYSTSPAAVRGTYGPYRLGAEGSGLRLVLYGK